MNVVDRGAVFAGWVGLGVAVVVAITFELIVAVQPVVFLLAPFIGLLIGVYANVRAQRWRPRWRPFANAAWASLVTGLGLAALYVIVRLVFVYGDTGVMPDGSRLACPTGPECGYQRWVESGRQAMLAEQGVTDAASFESAVLGGLAYGALLLVVLNVGGGLVAGAGRALTRAADARVASQTARSSSA
jgi:hypothetical protein